MAANMKPIKLEMMKEVNIPSGGRFGRDRKTISGREYSQIAKYRVMGILKSDARTASSIDVS
jgi:hypothetical protein